ncbi:MAG: DUF402 domain-containing protein [Haloarculaceae archaeon]
MKVRIRGVYTTALTERLRDRFEVVAPSDPIRDRFDADFETAPHDADVADTDDRQGVELSGAPDAVDALAADLGGVSRDTFAWPDPAPRDAVFDGVVTDTLGSGAVVDLGERTGFLPYSNADDYVDEGDVFRAQVTGPHPPWSEGRPVLDTDLALPGGLADLTRGSVSGQPTGELARMEDLLPVEVPAGWSVRWAAAADDASMDALGDALAALAERARTLDAALADAPAPDDGDVPRELAAPSATTWAWFGREGRFALDDDRARVATTMPGHHRTKAAHRAASAAVDFAEAVCEPAGEFPFAAVTRQFGPTEGDRVAIGHGKPDGRYFVLGEGEVTTYDPEGGITLRREMSPGGTYDALDVERRAGDVAITRFREGRWWYPTVYRGADGERRGTYVNVCTPVELFPETVRYVDLEVDVVKHADGTVERVDDDDLDAAVDAGHVSADLASKAREVAGRLADAL